MARDKIVKSTPAASALAKWDAGALAKMAEEAADKETLAGNFLTVRAGQLSLAGQPIKGNAVNVVVVASIYENDYYPGKFDPNNVTPPTCYAFGELDRGMSPHEDALEQQSESCDTCQWNRWGTGKDGRGKGCQNRRRLALIPAGELSPEAVAAAEIAYFKLPVTSVRNWQLYTKGLSKAVGRPAFAVVTKMAVVPDPKSQFKVTFEVVGPVPDEVLGAVFARAEEQKEAIAFPYAKPVEAKPEATGGKF